MFATPDFESISFQTIIHMLHLGNTERQRTRTYKPPFVPQSCRKIVDLIANNQIIHREIS